MQQGRVQSGSRGREKDRDVSYHGGRSGQQGNGKGEKAKEDGGRTRRRKGQHAKGRLRLYCGLEQRSQGHDGLVDGTVGAVGDWKWVGLGEGAAKVWWRGLSGTVP